MLIEFNFSSLGLYPFKLPKKSRDGFHNLRNYEMVVVNPILFFTDFPNKNHRYAFKMHIKPSLGKNIIIITTHNFTIIHILGAQSGFGIPIYEDASLRSEGYIGYGPLITSHNVRTVTDRTGKLVLNIVFTIKELEHCKPYDREDYTIERCIVAKDMTELFMSDKCSDFKIILGEEVIPSHKVILAAHSKVFERMLNETDSSELKLNMRASREAYIELLRFCYNNTIKNLKQHLEDLIMLAKEFEVEGLRNLCLLEVAHSIEMKYKKISSHTQVPTSIITDEEKAFKFYKLLNEMTDLINGKKEANPTPSSSKYV